MVLYHGPSCDQILHILGALFSGSRWMLTFHHGQGFLLSHSTLEPQSELVQVVEVVLVLENVHLLVEPDMIVPLEHWVMLREIELNRFLNFLLVQQILRAERHEEYGLLGLHVDSVWVVGVETEIEQIDIVQVVYPGQYFKLIEHQDHHCVPKARLYVTLDRKTPRLLIVCEASVEELPDQIRDRLADIGYQLQVILDRHREFAQLILLQALIIPQIQPVKVVQFTLRRVN